MITRLINELFVGVYPVVKTYQYLNFFKKNMTPVMWVITGASYFYLSDQLDKTASSSPKLNMKLILNLLASFIPLLKMK